jgi:hypothetical protein
MPFTEQERFVIELVNQRPGAMGRLDLVTSLTSRAQLELGVAEAIISDMIANQVLRKSRAGGYVSAECLEEGSSLPEASARSL